MFPNDLVVWEFLELSNDLEGRDWEWSKEKETTNVIISRNLIGKSLYPFKTEINSLLRVKCCDFAPAVKSENSNGIT